MTAAVLLRKARRSAASARLLLDTGDLNGACNGAYYAIFDAARAALLACLPPVKSATIKTNSGLIAAFSLHLIKTGCIPAALGKSKRRADQIRTIAGYTDEDIDAYTGALLIEQVQVFIDAVAQYLDEPRLPLRA